MQKYATSFSKLNSIIWIIIFCALSFYAQTETANLELGKPIEKETSGGQAHLYNIALKADQFVHAIITQKGVDVTVRFYEPNGDKIAEFDKPCGANGPELLHIVTQSEGVYRLEIKAKEQNTKAGKYSINLDEVRESNSDDETRIKAEELLWYGQFGYNQRKVETYQQGLIKLNEALPLYQQINDKNGLSLTYEYFGWIYNIMGKYSLALESFGKVLTLAREKKNRRREASMLNIIGTIYGNQHLVRRAIDYFTESAALNKELGLTDAVISNLNNIAGCYGVLGEESIAIEKYQEVLKLLREQKNPNSTTESFALTSIGDTVAAWDRKSALNYYEESLAIARKSNDPRVLSQAFTHFGRFYFENGDFPQAIDYYNQAMKLWDEPRRRERFTKGNQMLGKIYLKKGEYELALENFTKSKDLLIENPYLQADTILGIGELYMARKDYPEALKNLNEALKVFIEYESKLQEIETSLLIAEIEKIQGKPEASIERFEKALAYFEKQREQFSNQEVRASYFSNFQPAYESYIEVLMQLHNRNPNGNYSSLALQINERAHARSLLEQLTETRVDFQKGVDPLLVKNEKDASENLSAKAQLLTSLIMRKSDAEEIALARQGLETAQIEYQKIKGRIRAANSAGASLTQPVPLSLKEIQQEVLDDDTVILEYSLGEEKSFLFAVTQNSLQSFELPKRPEIDKKARAYFDALTARNKQIKFETSDEKQVRIEKADAELPALSQSLSQIILVPAQSALTKKRILIVADEILQYIPFASLPIKKQPLVANYEIVFLPSASTLAVLRREFAGRKSAPKTIAVLADPVFSSTDERFKTLEAIKKHNVPNQITVASKTRGVDLNESELNRAFGDFSEGDSNFSFSRLPFTRKEAEAISALVTPNAEKISLDFAASHENATNPELSNYQIIHFATHSFLDSKHPELSGIVLSLLDEEGNPKNGFLRTDEIYNLNLRAELVVLSGCKTGLGKEIRGEGLVGLTRGFMYAGAKRVAGSLWDVNDEATSVLMANFYREMFGSRKLPPAAALRRAQLSMLKDKRWNNPYYWSAFILQGEPK